MAMRRFRKAKPAFLSAIGMGLCLLLVTAGISTPVAARSTPPAFEICTLFDVSYLTECGGAARRGTPSLKAEWMGPEGSLAAADVGILVPAQLSNMQETQQGFYDNYVQSPEVVGTIDDLIINGCKYARFARVSTNGAPIYEHGTGLCFGFTFNYYAQGPLAGGGEAKFRDAVSALGRDILNNP